MQQQLAIATSPQAQQVIQHPSHCRAPMMKRVRTLAAALLHWKQAHRTVGNLVVSPLLYMCPQDGGGALLRGELSTTAQATTSCGVWMRWPGTCRRMVCASVAWTALSALRRRLALMRQPSPNPGLPPPAAAVAAGAGCLPMVEMHPRLLSSTPPPAQPPRAVPPQVALQHVQVCPPQGPPCHQQQPRWHLRWPGLRERNPSASGTLVQNSVGLLTVSWCPSCWRSVTRMPYGSRLSAVAPLQIPTPQCITLPATPSPVLCPGRPLVTISLAKTL